VKFAEACGGAGFRCERPEEVRPALQAAFSSNKPAIVEAVVDPYEPPMPAAVAPQQALKFAEAIVRGEPDAGKIIKTVFKDKIKELV
jgi:thiamine pyrophosphate-dependent acetolactate synthase large subunit-like protein